MGLSPPSAKKNLGPIPTSIFEWDLFHLEAVGPIPWDLVDFTAMSSVSLEKFDYQVQKDFFIKLSFYMVITELYNNVSMLYYFLSGLRFFDKH